MTSWRSWRGPAGPWIARGRSTATRWRCAARPRLDFSGFCTCFFSPYMACKCFTQLYHFIGAFLLFDDVDVMLFRFIGAFRILKIQFQVLLQCFSLKTFIEHYFFCFALASNFNRFIGFREVLHIRAFIGHRFSPLFFVLHRVSSDLIFQKHPQNKDYRSCAAGSPQAVKSLILL